MMLKEGEIPPPAPKIACATDFLNYAAFSIMFFLAFRFYLVLPDEGSCGWQMVNMRSQLKDVLIYFRLKYAITRF